MQNVIIFNNLRSFAYCNSHLCVAPIRGIVLSFFGLNGASMFDEDPVEACQYAEKGILYVVPYQNPWAWMNKQTVAYTDEIIDVLFQEYQLKENLPIISTGQSMGGLSALVYSIYAKRTPTACVANCPVCDLPYHYKERPDLPRTLYSAFGSYSGTLEEALRSASPIHLVDRMPQNMHYYVFHCEEDMSVNKQQHSDRFVEKMRFNHVIDYYTVPNRGHCDLTKEMRGKYNECILQSIDEAFEKN